MSGERGYGYAYTFSMVDMRYIKSKMKSRVLHDGVRAVILEMRSMFTIDGTETVGKETYDLCDMYTRSSQDHFFYLAHHRLSEYWMDEDQIHKFSEDAVSFIRGIAARYPSLDRIAVAVNFEVCTIPKPGEEYADTMARAIVPRKLKPMYLHLEQSVKRRPLDFQHVVFLSSLPTVRVERRDEGERLMPACPLCCRVPNIGDQIACLPCTQGCAYHLPCIVRKLERWNQCPCCKEEVYDIKWLKSPCYDTESDCDSD